MAHVDGTSEIPEGTGRGLLSFLDFAVDKGYLKTATGQAMKTACKEVLSATEGDTWERSRLAELDLEDTLRRFETLRAMKFSIGSLNTYKARYKKSLAMFEEFRSNPGAWRPDLRARNRSPRKAANESGGERASAPAAPPPDLTPSAHPTSSVITYPFPLREGVLASLQLPADLTAREARRLAAFINSLAFEDPGSGRASGAES